MGDICVQTTVKVILLLCMIELCASALVRPFGHSRKLSALMKEQPLLLTYHHGPLLTSSVSLDVNLIWYGKFTPIQRSIVADYVQSLSANANLQPSVSTWWKMTESYKDASNKAVLSSARLGKQKLDESYSLAYEVT